MNTHLNLVTERERKHAETLRSFSLDPVSRDIEPPRWIYRRLVFPACLFALVSATAVGVTLYPPDVVRRVGVMVATLSQPEGTLEDAASVSGDADAPPVRGRTEATALLASIPATGEITGSGFVVAPRMTTVFSKYEGRITHVAVEAGDAVTAGQVLVTLDDASARFALEQAKAAKSAAELQLAGRAIDLSQARASLTRIETLAAREATSKQSLEQARTASGQASNAVEQARRSVATADLSIRIADEHLDELTVRAPFAGIVTRLDAHVGATVLARVDSVRESQSLLTITDTTGMVIDADVAETNIAALRTGLRGEAVLDGFPDKPFTVSVVRLAPVVSAEKGTITLRLSLADPPEGIRPNMAARLRIPLNDTGDMTQ